MVRYPCARSTTTIIFLGSLIRRLNYLKDDQVVRFMKRIIKCGGDRLSSRSIKRKNVVFGVLNVSHGCSFATITTSIFDVSFMLSRPCLRQKIDDSSPFRHRVGASSTFYQRVGSNKVGVELR